MKDDEYMQKRRVEDAILVGGCAAVFLMMVAALVFALTARQCGEVPEYAAPHGPTGWSEACALVVLAEPEPVKVRDFHLGQWQDYVANLPKDWPMKPDVGTWPQMMSNSCFMGLLCLWIDYREGEDCDRLRTWPQCVGDLAVKGGWHGDS